MVSCRTFEASAIAPACCKCRLRLSRDARHHPTVFDTCWAYDASDQPGAIQTLLGRFRETAAEAFERMLLYLCAAMDRYARVIRTLFDTTLDAKTSAAH